MKIALVSPHYGPPWTEGVRNMARNLVEFLSARGEEVHVISRGVIAESGPISAALLNIPGIRAPFFNLMAGLRARELDPDKVVLLASLSSVLGLKCFVLRRMTKKPLVAYITGLRRWTWGYRILLRAERFIVNSDFLKVYLQEAEVIPPFIDTARFTAAQVDNRSSSRTVLYLGAFEKCRGVEYLIRAMAYVSADLGAKLVLAWDGRARHRYRHIRNTIKASGMSRRVELVEHADVVRLYREAAIVVIPRIRPERMAFPLRILEAVTAGVPLVVSSVSGMDRLVKGCGLPVEPRNEHELAAAIEWLLADRELYLLCVRNCGGRARAWNVQKSLARFYRELLYDREYEKTRRDRHLLRAPRAESARR